MNESSLLDLVRARKTRDAAPLIGMLIALLAIWGTLSVRLTAVAADIQRLETVTISVARMDTDVDHIKRGMENLERVEMQHHERVLTQLAALQTELNYLRVARSTETSPPE